MLRATCKSHLLMSYAYRTSTNNYKNWQRRKAWTLACRVVWITHRYCNASSRGCFATLRFSSTMDRTSRCLRVASCTFILPRCCSRAKPKPSCTAMWCVRHASTCGKSIEFCLNGFPLWLQPFFVPWRVDSREGDRVNTKDDFTVQASFTYRVSL